MKTLLNQLKNRRISLGLKQHDMFLRIGVSRQQYQQLESRGNPRLDTLELVAKGLKSRIMLIPEENLNTVQAVLEGSHLAEESADATRQYPSASQSNDRQALSDDPWRGMLGDDE
ncbi:MAG: helix-turn-helix transcriptional regulator [Gammaproteobacteria bacterium]|nr:helix-turn-helix transcriptional regulator [Gammaproteobacteria bacterium]MYG96878.1 helix-turn-helix transcriptional regulator [Gammaproteobacteria bacterium]